ncbi:ABC transporter permease [Halobacterium salinarum]|uniref:ABC transporter permease n=1 Tax=Halobacterium salinarum TaxID=2242 RepID=UPI001F46963E|nr:ABC transporter permease [Halobacterium salinarum]MCF2166138.1 ABC transporter permease [Halobacterium salinarum]MCF2167621.1 ABC transporter permease [Halobacterium salinarum]
MGDTDSVLGRLVGSPRARLAALLAPSGGLLVALLFAPLSFMIAVSFARVSDASRIIWHPTAANYTALVDATPFWSTPFVTSLLLSVGIAAATTVVCLVAAYPVAYALARRDRGRRVVFFLVLLPFFTMYLVRVYSWYLLFGDGGVLNDIATVLGVGPVDAFGFGVPAIVVGLAHAQFPYMLLTLYAGIEAVDFDVLEAARDLGASRRAVFRDVLLPLTLPNVVAGSLFVFVPAFGSFVAPRFLSGSTVLLVGQLIAGRIDSFNIASASAAATVVVVLIAAAFGVAARYTDASAGGDH